MENMTHSQTYTRHARTHDPPSRFPQSIGSNTASVATFSLLNAAADGLLYRGALLTSVAVWGDVLVSGDAAYSYVWMGCGWLFDQTQHTETSNNTQKHDIPDDHHFVDRSY